MANEIKIQKKYVSGAPVLDITTTSGEYVVPVETTPIPRPNNNNDNQDNGQGQDGQGER